MRSVQVMGGDCLTIMPRMGESVFDTVITDPPYGLEFMGKDWDRGIPGGRFWREALRVAKPGAHLLAFGGTRTHHRLMVAIEDAGWIIRDVIMWVYGEGFPKSHNISKALNGRGATWDGYGTALKPAWEPIIVAMKPIDGTYANNAEAWGVSGLWIDGGRVETGEKSYYKTDNSISDFDGNTYGFKDYKNMHKRGGGHTQGRWPANLIHDGSAEVTGLFPNSDGRYGAKNTGKVRFHPGDKRQGQKDTGGTKDSGSAARFFYCAKAKKKERNAGLESLPEQDSMKWAGGNEQRGLAGKYPDGRPRPKQYQANHHPTVKPVALMRYLARLTRPPAGGVVFDPFMGSGSTGIGAILEDRGFVGIDLNPDYVEIAKRRIWHHYRGAQGKLI